MNRDELEAWLADHHYPQLVLPEGDIVRHREWQSLLTSTSARLERALERINTFIERLEHRKEETV